MTTIQRVEFFSYELPKEVITSFLDERKKSLNTSLEGCKISISIHALNFALIQQIDYLVTFVLESVSKEALNLSRTLTYALSPLHIAVILGRLDLVKQLVKAGMDVNLCDHRQWTPLHHAALSGCQEIIDFLNEHGADQKALTREEGTYRDIFRLTQPPFYKPDQKISLMWKEDKEEASQLSMGQFKEMTGAHYLEENYVSRPWMITRWKEVNKTDEELKQGPDSVTALYKQKYASSFLNLPMLTLCQVAPLQKGICATLDLESGTVLGEYLAHIGPQEVNDYTLSTYWQALTYRNPIAMANDGFPNARLVPIYNFQGLCKRYLLVALSPIKTGEQICWNYTSSHPLKTQPYLEFRGEALREFIGTCIPEEIEERTKKEIESQVQKKFNFDASMDQFKYLIDTPVLLFKMVWDGSTQAAHLKKLVNAFFRCISVENQEKILEGQLKLIQLAEQALKIKERMSALDTTFSQGFSESIETLLREKDLKDIFVMTQSWFPELELKLKEEEGQKNASKT